METPTGPLASSNNGSANAESSILLATIRRPLVQYLLMYLAVLCVFVPTFWYTYVWDDYMGIVQNDSIREWKNIPRFFSDPATFGDVNREHGQNDWRPIRNVYFLLTYKIQGMHPAGWHFHHVLLHCLCAAMVLMLFHRLISFAINTDKELPPAILAAAWFSVYCWAIHPANTEVTAWIKSADDVLSCLFTALSLITLFPHHGKLSYSRICCSALLFALAVLSKGSVVTLPLIYPAMFIILSPRWKVFLRSRRVWFATAVLLIITGIYLSIRTTLLGRIEQMGYMAGSFSLMMATMSGAVVRYLQLTFWPFWPTVQIGDYAGWPLAKSWLEPAVVFHLSILLMLLVILVEIFRRNKIVAAGWAFAALAFLPVANIIPMMQVMAERFMYFPMVGLAFAICPVYSYCFRKKLFMAIPIVVSIALAVTTLHRLPVWDSGRAFQKANVAALPQNPRARYNLAVELLDAGETTRALGMFLEAERSRPDHLKSAITANQILQNLGHETSATEHLDKVIERFPKSIVPLTLQADRARFKKDYRKAAAYYDKAIKLEQANARLWYFHAYCHYQLGEMEVAKQSLLQSLKLESIPEAKKLLEKIRDLQNGNPVTHADVTTSTQSPDQELSQ